MRYVVGTMMVSFFAIGLALIWHALRVLWQFMRRRPHLLRTQGIILSIQHKRVQFTTPRMHSTTANYPVIQFRTATGETITFQSAVGDLSHASRYVPGQSIPVRYDPSGAIPPMIDAWSSMWGVPLATAAGGLAFVGGAAVIWLAFGDRILGG